MILPHHFDYEVFSYTTNSKADQCYKRLMVKMKQIAHKYKYYIYM